MVDILIIVLMVSVLWSCFGMILNNFYSLDGIESNFIWALVSGPVFWLVIGIAEYNRIYAKYFIKFTEKGVEVINPSCYCIFI